jgi:hypothetical protein
MASRKDKSDLHDEARSPQDKEAKICRVCGRTITWRKKWESNWEAIQYCSDACRRKKQTLKLNWEEAILLLLSTVGKAQMVLTSDVLPPEDRDCRTKLEQVREAARRLAAAGTIEIIQNGLVMDPSRARGPYSVRIKPTLP